MIPIFPITGPGGYYFPKDTGTPPDVFGRNYSKNQRKQRKQRRQNPHLYRKTK